MLIFGKTLDMAKKNIALEKFDFRDLSESTDSPIALQGFITPIIETAYKVFRNKEDNKRIIEFYEFYKEKIEELKYRSNIQYTLSIAKNRKTNDTIIAKVKWPYKIKGEYRKYGFISVFIASTTKFPKGLKDPNLKSFAEEKIYQYINKNAPIELLDASGKPYQI
jgi:hypothetical protein